jgi:hypothetical protein
MIGQIADAIAIVLATFGFIAWLVTKGDFYNTITDISGEREMYRQSSTDAIVEILGKRKFNDDKKMIPICLGLALLSLAIPREDFPEQALVRIVLVLIVVLILSNHIAVQYRIAMGWYGNNEREVREIIEFIIREWSDIDFGHGVEVERVLSEEGG